MFVYILGPIDAGGPYNITASLGDTVLMLEDVLFGDVWVCSGQSNMQFSVSQVSLVVTFSLILFLFLM